MASFVEATDKFLKVADWLGDEDAPLVVALEQTAKALDIDYQSAGVSQYRQLYQALEKKRPSVTAVDPVDEAIDGLRDDGDS